MIQQMIRMLKTTRKIIVYQANHQSIYIQDYLNYDWNPAHDLGRHIREFHMLQVEVGRLGYIVSQWSVVDHLIITLPPFWARLGTELRDEIITGAQFGRRYMITMQEYAKQVDHDLHLIANTFKFIKEVMVKNNLMLFMEILKEQCIFINLRVATFLNKTLLREKIANYQKLQCSLYLCMEITLTTYI